MPVIDQKNVLSGLRVKEAMRRQIIHLPPKASIDQCINRTIKYKVNSLLVMDDGLRPIGVVSKTDLMGAYYAGLALDLPLQDIMVGPPVLCHPDDALEAALDRMRSHGIHRLYVVEGIPPTVVGVLANPDIVGLLYRYCRRCDRNLLNRGKAMPAKDMVQRLSVKEVMTPGVKACREQDRLLDVMEKLAAYGFGAVLVRNDHHLPVGVISKTDLMMAYKHGISTDSACRRIMHAPVHACHQDEFLSTGIQQMLYSDLQRLFVYRNDPNDIVGVLSLSDAARVRSGSCRACVSSRIQIGNP